MKKACRPHPAIVLSTNPHCRFVYTVTGLLPPAPDGSRGARRSRNRSAIAKAAARLPVNANDIGGAMRLNARDAWTLHVAERSMRSVTDPAAEWS